MFIKIICIVALLEFSLSTDPPTLPMKKDSKYGDDVCTYAKDSHVYVKHCKKGKFCNGDLAIDTLDTSIGRFFEETNIYICQDLPNITSLYDVNEESCTNDFECKTGYKCIGNVCSIKCDSGYFYSEDGCMKNSLRGTDGICREITIKKNVLNYDFKYSPPEPNKKCGKLTFADNPNDDMKGIYYVNKYEYVYKGEVEDGEYVNDQELCKSGFALYFFKDGKSEDPKDESAIISNELYLRCVTPISISKSKNNENLINYKINEDGKILIYNLNRLRILTNSPYTKYYEIYDAYFDNPNPKYNFNFFVKYIQLKYEKYREYYTSMTEEERKTCGDLDGTNKYTCENNKLIRSWYFYNHPDKYSAYNDRKKIRKIVDYLIQKEYPCYSLSQFLSIKFIYLLFLLLF